MEAGNLPEKIVGEDKKYSSCQVPAWITMTISVIGNTACHADPCQIMSKYHVPVRRSMSLLFGQGSIEWIRHRPAFP